MKLKFIEGTENNCPVLKGDNWRLELFRCYYFQMLRNHLTIQSRLNFRTELDSAFGEGEDGAIQVFCHLISSFREDKNLLLEILEGDEDLEVLTHFIKESLDYYGYKYIPFDKSCFYAPPRDIDDCINNDEYFRNVLEAYNSIHVITREGFMFIAGPRFKENIEYLGIDYEEARKLFLSPKMKEVGVRSNDDLWIRKILEVNGLLESEMSSIGEARMKESDEKSAIVKDNDLSRDLTIGILTEYIKNTIAPNSWNKLEGETDTEKVFNYVVARNAECRKMKELVDKEREKKVEFSSVNILKPEDLRK